VNNFRKGQTTVELENNLSLQTERKCARNLKAGNLKVW